LVAIDGVTSIVVILVLGFIGFFVVLAVMITRLVGYVLRALFGNSRDRTDPVRQVPLRTGRICPDPRCAHVNSAAARYCARCGQSLGAVCDVDAYG